MALISCPECEEQISDKALACPHCGYPLRERRRRRSAQAAAPAAPEKKLPLVTEASAARRKYRYSVGAIMPI